MVEVHNHSVSIWCARKKEQFFVCRDIYRPQRSCEGYVFTGVCVSTGGGGGIPACLAGGIPACLAAGLQEGGGIPACLAGSISACLAAGLQGGSCSEGEVPAPGGGGACSQGCVEETLPASRRLLLRRVCILLECTLLFDKYTQEMRN